MKEINVRTISKKIKQSFSKKKYLQDQLIEDISEKTGFKRSKIVWLMSKRSQPDIPILDHHEFTYIGNKYFLIGNNIVLDKRK